MQLGRRVVLAALVLGSSTLSAQGRLSGVVRDTLGKPVAGVEVSLQGIPRPVATSQKGEFEFRGLKAGTVTVSVRRLGYAPQTMILKVVDGENTLDDIVLTAIPRELDTVMTREQELWRERPLLREMEENRKLGMGQFVTRAALASNQGGFLKQHFNQMRGLAVVTEIGTTGSKFWLANKYIPNIGGCTELEDNSPKASLSPRGPYGGPPNCDYCFPTVYLDYSRLSSGRMAPNLARFNPDQLEAMEVYLGAAETPTRYASGASSCGVIVLHTRAVDSKARVIAAKQDHPTRSRVFASTSIAAGARCFDCNRGPSGDVSLGYTVRDRWVIAGRYAAWSNEDGGAQSIRLTQALVEWYPKRDPGRFKWFVNSGLGFTFADVNTSGESGARHADTRYDHYVGSGLASMVVGTGMDVAVVRRFVVTPFFSYTRTLGGQLEHTPCVNELQSDGVSRVYQCFGTITEPGNYNLRQLGVRFGWR